VVEAAFFLLRQGLLNIPDVGTINVKQAHAFLWNAAWLQEHMSVAWRESGDIDEPPPGDVVGKFCNFGLAIISPGGSGKTAVLKVTEALTTFFIGPGAVKKLAPSNAAARLLGGDTLHSMCNLPFGQKVSLSSKRGHLSKQVLQKHRKTWAPTVAAYIDELSMVSSDQPKIKTKIKGINLENNSLINYFVCISPRCFQPLITFPLFTAMAIVIMTLLYCTSE